MKKLFLTPVLALLFAGVSVLQAQNQNQEYIGLPGDNLNLYAVMSLFQESQTLEEFERGLNDPETVINNLDLNNDNLVDYIMVFDYKEGNVNTIVLRVALNERDYQDVAVFTVQKFRDGSVAIQLIGDEALYGRNYIIEPNYAETPNPGYRGRGRQSRNVTVVNTTYYEVATWPIIVYIHNPHYVLWRSSWYWGYYPTYWYPRNPYYWHYYHGYHSHWHSHYHMHYRTWNHHRTPVYHTTYYTSIRNYSPTVVVNINNGRYRDSYSRPDRRSEGEARFAQRYPDGKPTRVVNAPGDRAEGRRGRDPQNLRDQENRVSGSGNNNPANAGPRTRGTQQSTGGREERAVPAENNGRRQSGVNSNGNSNNVRSRGEAPNREERTVTPESRNRRNENAAPSRREESAPVRQQTERPSNNQRNENAAPARRQESAPSRPQQERPSVNERNERATPAPQREERPVNNQRNERVTPAPQREERPSNNQRNESTAPSRREQSAPAREVERPQNNQRNERTAPAPAREERSSPRNERPARTNQREESRMSSRKVQQQQSSQRIQRSAPAPSRVSSPAPSRSVQQRTSAPQRSERVAPAPSRSSSQAPSRSVQRSAPQRSESRTAPARTERSRSSETNASSRPQRNR